MLEFSQPGSRNSVPTVLLPGKIRELRQHLIDPTEDVATVDREAIGECPRRRKDEARQQIGSSALCHGKSHAATSMTIHFPPIPCTLFPLPNTGLQLFEQIRREMLLAFTDALPLISLAMAAQIANETATAMHNMAELFQTRRGDHG